VFRHFPLRTVHPQAEMAAEASECAALQSDFFTFHDVLFQNQSALLQDDLVRYALQSGLDANAVAACLDAGSEIQRVQEDVDAGTALSVTGTPTFFIGSTKVIGFQDSDSMASLIDQALADQ